MTYITPECIYSLNQFDKKQSLNNALSNPINLVNMKSLPEKINLIEKQYKITACKETSSFISDAVKSVQNFISNIKLDLKNLSCIANDNNITNQQKVNQFVTILSSIRTKMNNEYGAFSNKLFTKLTYSMLSEDSLFYNCITYLDQTLHKFANQQTTYINIVLGLPLINANNPALSTDIKSISNSILSDCQAIQTSLDRVNRDLVNIDMQYSRAKIDMEKVQKKVVDNCLEELSGFYQKNTFESMINLERKTNLKNNLAEVIGSRL